MTQTHSSSLVTTSPAAERQAHTVCGWGTMSDLVSSDSLDEELERFYEEDPESAAVVSILRVYTALELLAPRLVGSSRIAKTPLRSIWSLLRKEMSQAFKRHAVEEYRPLRRIAKTINTGGYNAGTKTWDMGFVREALAKGWPTQLKLPVKLGPNALGPLQWWYSLDSLAANKSITRQDIFDAALQKFNDTHRQRGPVTQPLQTERNSEAAPRDASSSTRSPRPAANAALAANRKIPVKDDGSDPTYTPGLPGKADRTSRASPPQPSASTANAQQQANAGQAEAPPETGNGRKPKPKPAPSPWLPPPGFTADVKWQCEDYNALYERLVNWSADEPIPDALLWEHPSMHGCPVDKETGMPMLCKPACATCKKYKRNCWWRGSKACTPCFWEKGSHGACHSPQPDVASDNLRHYKPDFARRMAFLNELEAKGKIKFPSHFVDEAGRARRSTTTGPTPRPAKEESIAPENGPRVPSPSPDPDPAGRSESPVALTADLDQVEHAPETQAPGSSAPVPEQIGAGSLSSSAMPNADTVDGPPPPASVHSPATQAPAQSAVPSGDSAVEPVIAADTEPRLSTSGDSSPLPASPSMTTIAAVPAAGVSNISSAATPSLVSLSKQPTAGSAPLLATSPAPQVIPPSVMVAPLPEGGPDAKGRSPAITTSIPGPHVQDSEMDNTAAQHSQTRKRTREVEPPLNGALSTITNGDSRRRKRNRLEDDAAEKTNADPAADSQDVAMSEAATQLPRAVSASAEREVGDDAPRTSRSTSNAPSEVTATHESGKAKRRSTARPSGEAQRSTAGPGVTIHLPPPGSRFIPRSGSPNEFPPVRPQPVIPGLDMRTAGDKAGTSSVSQTLSTPLSVGDILLVDCVERSIRHGVQEGLKTVHDDLRDVRSDLRDERELQRQLMGKIDALPGQFARAATFESPRVESAPSTAAPDQSGYQQMLSMMTALGLKMDSMGKKLDPLTLRVDTLDKKMDPLSTQVAQLHATYGSLATRMDRLEAQANGGGGGPYGGQSPIPASQPTEGIDKGDEMPTRPATLSPPLPSGLSASIVGNPPPSSTGESAPEPAHTYSRPTSQDNLTGGQGVSGATDNEPPAPVREPSTPNHSERSPSPHPSALGETHLDFAGREPHRVASDALDSALKVVSPPPLPSREDTPTPRARNVAPSGPVTLNTSSSPATASHVQPVQTPAQSESPLTSNLSPGNLQLLQAAEKEKEMASKDEKAVDEEMDVEDQNMETGDDWLPTPGKRRPAEVESDDVRPAKRHAGDDAIDAEGADEDAEGSVDEGVGTAAEPGPVTPARGKGRAKGPPRAPGNRSRRVATRNHPMPRSG
ncbi:unnamed protein product [Peniophora sp. CBMAI 1063]|nr:unnamed protein product [Peniophora sp. CBMAI 1063]